MDELKQGSQEGNYHEQHPYGCNVTAKFLHKYIFSETDDSENMENAEER